MMKNDILYICKDVLTGFPEIKIAFLYGSYSTGQETVKSDVDIGIAGEKTLRTDEIMNISLHLSQRINKEIDITDLNRVSGVILHQILMKGTVLFVQDKELYISIVKRMLYNQADFMPYYHRVLTERRTRLLNG